MRRAAWRSKLKSPWVPPSRPTLTMRPLIYDQVDALAVGGFQYLLDPGWIGRIHREVGAEFLQAAAAHRIGRRADHGFRALEFGDLHRHQADAGTGALDQHRLSRLQAADGHPHIVHGGERNG